MNECLGQPLDLVANASDGIEDIAFRVVCLSPLAKAFGRLPMIADGKRPGHLAQSGTANLPNAPSVFGKLRKCIAVYRGVGMMWQGRDALVRWSATTLLPRDKPFALSRYGEVIFQLPQTVLG